MFQKSNVNTELLTTLYLRGDPIEDIAAVVGLKRGASVSSWAKRLGLPMRNNFGEKAVLHENFRADRRAGMTIREIADKYGVSIYDVNRVTIPSRLAQNDRKLANIARRAERDAKIVDMRKAGAKVADIAEDFGVSEATVGAVIKKAGLPVGKIRAKAKTEAVPEPARVKIRFSAAPEAVAKYAARAAK